MWLRYKVLPMGWSHLVVVGHSILDEFLHRVGHDPTLEIAEANSRSIGPAQFGLYIEDFFVFSSDKKTVQDIYDKVWTAFETVQVDPKSSKSEAPSRRQKSIIVIQWDSKGKLEPDMDKMTKVMGSNEDVTSFKVMERFGIVASRW